MRADDPVLAGSPFGVAPYARRTRYSFFTIELKFSGSLIAWSGIPPTESVTAGVRQLDFGRSMYQLIEYPGPIESASHVRRTEARSRNNGRPAGVAKVFQVVRHDIEPMMGNSCLNLFSNNDCRRTLADKVSKEWPQVAFVFDSFLSLFLSCDRKRLARTAPSIN